MEERKWIPYQEVDFNNTDYNTFSIDTRDFHCIASNRTNENLNLRGTSRNPELYYFNHDELKALLDRYFTESGGACEWRYFSIVGAECGWNMKYLRIFRKKKGFLLCTEFRDVYTVWKKKILNGEIDKKHLHNH